MSGEIRAADLMVEVSMLRQKLAQREELINDVFGMLDRGEKQDDVVAYMHKRMQVIKEVEA